MLTATFPSPAPERVAAFWAAMLDRRVVSDSYGLLLPGEHGQLGLRFPSGDAPRPPHPMHLHLSSADAAQQQATVTRALQLGGSHRVVGQLPDEEHVVLADVDGNELCVIEAGNSWLTGCGFLAELACDGSRAVGVFWSEALGWPLVWDQDGETAIQAPGGGTKVAWGGPSTSARRTSGPYLALVTSGELAAEVERLVRLGATTVDAQSTGGTLLLDPDGFAFRLLTPSSG